MVTRAHDAPLPGTSEAITRGIRVSVEAQYSAQHSQPQQGHWFFLYTIRITNESADTVQLISRHWVITDAAERVDEVKGNGVVGQQPVIAPGEQFEYTSGCPLTTPFGTMRGTYQLVTNGGDQFDTEIATFYLQGPYSVH